jgi:hypothetical protein
MQSMKKDSVYLSHMNNLRSKLKIVKSIMRQMMNRIIKKSKPHHQ